MVLIFMGKIWYVRVLEPFCLNPTLPSLLNGERSRSRIVARANMPES